MATKTTRKTTTKTNEVVEENVTEEKTNVKVVEKRIFDPNEEILCRSVTHGRLYVDGIKTGMKYTFYDYDDDALIGTKEFITTNNISLKLSTLLKDPGKYCSGLIKGDQGTCPHQYFS